MATLIASSEHSANHVVHPPGVFGQWAGSQNDVGRTLALMPDGERAAAARPAGFASSDVQGPDQGGRDSLQDPARRNPQAYRAEAPTWKGDRLFAVDGSKINLPRQLIDEGYRTPADNAHSPHGMVSVPYRLQSRMPTDFDLVAHGNESTAALAQLEAPSPDESWSTTGDISPMNCCMNMSCVASSGSSGSRRRPALHSTPLSPAGGPIPSSRCGPTARLCRNCVGATGRPQSPAPSAPGQV